MAAGRKKTSKKTSRRAAREEEEPEVEETEETEETEDDAGEDEDEEEGETEETSDEDSSEENGDPVRPELSKKERGALFVAYQAALDTVAEVEEALELAKGELTEKVQDIYDKVGEGPFVWRGATVRVMLRKGKAYMRTMALEAQEIEG